MLVVYEYNLRLRNMKRVRMFCAYRVYKHAELRTCRYSAESNERFQNAVLD